MAETETVTPGLEDPPQDQDTVEDLTPVATVTSSSMEAPENAATEVTSSSIEMPENAVAEVVTPVATDIVETVTMSEPNTSVGAEEIVIPVAGGESSNTAAVMQSIIEALTTAASETAELADKKDEEKQDVPEPQEEKETEPSISTTDIEDTTGIAAAAAALQVLANKASSLTSGGESLIQLQQVLQQSLNELPGTVASLVNEVAQEVVIMAKAAQHATLAAESMIDSEPEKVKRTKRGKLKIHKCSECGKGFTLKVTLMRHLELHTRELHCEHCNKVFFSPVKLAAHIKHHHVPWSEKERVAVCKVCGKGFYNNSKLKVHMRVHTGERPYACSFCEKTFQCSSHCKRHERLHTGEHPYVCEICEKGFGSPSNLKDHMYTHTKETPYKCDKCGRGFAQWGALQRHISAIHEKKKECKCDQCGKSFARKDYLRFHIQKCHWHRCGLCKSSFEHESDFQQHVKNCDFVPDVKLSTPRKHQSPRSLPGSAKRSPSKSPRKKPATEPRKRPISATTTPRKRRQVMDTSTDLLSIYDQFNDDPLADPDYDAFEEVEDFEGEEIVEEDGMPIDTEEILEQEEISQLEDIATGEIKILTQTEEEPVVTSGIDEEQARDESGQQKEYDEEDYPAEDTETNVFQDQAVDQEAAAVEELEEGKDNEKTGPVRAEGGEATLDSLVSALMSAAEGQAAAQPNKEE